MSNDTDQGVERYSFSGFTLDPARQVLQGPDGEIRLRPKSYALLLYLVRHPGRLVSRQELHDAVWGRLAVTDDSLTQCLVEIRRVLGDEGRQIVKTVPRRGYLFDAPVTRLVGDGLQDPGRTLDRNADEDGAHAEAGDGGRAAPRSAPPTPRGPLLSTGILAAATVVAMLAVWVAAQRHEAPPASAVSVVQRLPNSIAVLPFVDLSAEKDQEYFGDGMAEEILNLLVQWPELRVIARTSSFSFKNQPVDIATITQRLGVEHVLEGSVRKSGTQVRITAQLIAAHDGTHLWSQSYDRELGDLLVVQREIASAVAYALKASLFPDGTTTLAASTVDARAYDHFLHGRFLFHRRDAGDLERAREQFEAAIALDPGYARALAYLSGVYNAQMHTGEISWETGVQRRREAAEQALAMDAGLPEAHLRAIAVFADDGNVERALHHLELARAIDPDNSLLLGITSARLLAEGRVDEAIQQWDRIVANDPLSRLSRQNRGLKLMAAGRLEEARADLLVARDLGQTGEADTFLSLILVLEKRYEEALALLDPIPWSHDREVGLALAHHALGNTAEADAVVARLRADGSGDAAMALAEFHAHLGERAHAFSTLAEARARFERETRWSPRRWAIDLYLSPFLRPLHSDDRWVALYTERPSSL
jgi:TolB-like protein/DNA-binding winged helix-turn-helix (wHTH) protein/Tfp pilus assembly protein PilF